MKRRRLAWLMGCAFAVALGAAVSQGSSNAQTAIGVTDKEILLGGTFPMSGPVSSAGTIGKAVEAYFKYVNDQGGIHGRKIVYKIYDDGYQPPKTLQLTRQLVEEDKIFATAASLGTAPQTAVMDYLNEKKVPQLFVSSGDAKWGADPAKYPWTTGGGMPNYADEAVVYAKYLLKNRPEARIGILYQNDDMGITFLKGIEKGLGEKGSLILARQSFEITAADVSSQIANLKASGANTLFIAAMHKPVVQTLKTAAQMGWKPFLIIASTGSSMFAMSQVSPEIAEGSITTIFYKDTSDPQWDNDAGMKLHKEIMAKYYPEGKVVDAQNMFGMSMAWMVEQILRTTGRTLSREGLQNSWCNMNYDRNPFLMPGIVNKTTPTDPRPLRSLYMAKFEVKEGKGRWAPFGEVIDARGQ